MKQIGQIYTHQIPITEADQCLLHDEIIRAGPHCGRLAAQTNGWSSRKYELGKYSIDSLVCMYAYMISELLNDVAGAKKQVRFWFVGLEPDGKIDWHDHHQSDWSAVFYPHSVDESEGGSIMFDDGTIIRPHAGLVVLFPGTLKHKVRPYHGSAPRLSVAFNRDIEGE